MALKGLILAIAFAERRLTSSISKVFCSRKKYPSERSKNRQRRRSVSAVMLRAPEHYRSECG